jgi:four helix bundle protein
MEYKDLDVWIESRLVKLIYNETIILPGSEKFGLTNQIRGCSVSIPSNIGEGYGRQYKTDSIHFFYISRGSLYELETQIYLCFDLEYITQASLNYCFEYINKCKMILNGFINYYKTLGQKKKSFDDGYKNELRSAINSLPRSPGDQRIPTTNN